MKTSFLTLNESYDNDVIMQKNEPPKQYKVCSIVLINYID